MKCLVKIAGLLAVASLPALAETAAPYPWTRRYVPANAVAARVRLPAGYARAPAAPRSFAAWLRGLPLKPGRPPVLLFDGRRKSNQKAHVAVVDIDVGRRDLQQCADAVMRLRAEYLYATGRRGLIRFDFTSGDRAAFARWAEGYRPLVRGRLVTWQRRGRPDTSYAALRAYLDTVFTYAGSASLSREMLSIPRVQEMRVGDVFVRGGFPGHAVIVVDMAAHGETGRKIFLLAQSYMPAQDIHILKNPNARDGSPWYPLDFGDRLHTPEWTFRKTDLKRFRGP